MEDVWNFGETFDCSIPRMSAALVKKIILYSSQEGDVIVDPMCMIEMSAVYTALAHVETRRKYVIFE
jgi:hypothetical protein